MMIFQFFSSNDFQNQILKIHFVKFHFLYFLYLLNILVKKYNHTIQYHCDALIRKKNRLYLRILKKIMELFQLKIVLTQFKRQVARNACTKGGESTDPCVVRDAMLPRSCSCGVNFGLCSITYPRQRRRLGSTIELCMPTYCRCTVCNVSCISETCSLIDVITPCRDVNSYN